MLCSVVYLVVIYLERCWSIVYFNFHMHSSLTRNWFMLIASCFSRLCNDLCNNILHLVMYDDENTMITNYYISRECRKSYHPHCLQKDDSFLESEDHWACGKKNSVSFELHRYLVIFPENLLSRCLVSWPLFIGSLFPKMLT